MQAQKSVIKQRDDSYTRLKSESNAQLTVSRDMAKTKAASSVSPTTRKNYFVYLLICVLMIVFLLLIGLSLLYKLNRAIISRRQRHKRRHTPSSKRASMANAHMPSNLPHGARCGKEAGPGTSSSHSRAELVSSNPFEFFNLFNRPVKSEYEYGGYFGLEEASSACGRSTDKNTVNTLTNGVGDKRHNTSHTITTTVNNTSSCAEKKVLSKFLIALFRMFPFCLN